MNAALFLLVAVLTFAVCGGAALAEAPVAGAQATVGPDGLLDLNTASAAQLESLPGIGPSRAQAILAFREAHGGFRSVFQLLRIKGIGRAMLRKLQPLVTVSGVPQKP